MSYFKLSEFYRDDNVPSAGVVRKIKLHIKELDSIRDILGEPIIISKHSGYRSVRHERERGRSGTSEHCFRGRGAVDLTGRDPELLLDILIDKSSYNRICYYPENGFVHCDWKENSTHRLFQSVYGEWVRV